MICEAVIVGILKDSAQKIDMNYGAYSTRFLGKIHAEFEQIAANYSNFEMFRLYNRSFNGNFNGFWMTQQFTEFSSAFLDVEFLEYSLSIPPKLKYRWKIYLDWIRRKHRDIGKYKWEQTMTSINKWHPYFRAVSFCKRAIRALKRRLHLSRHYSMIPIEAWYRNNPSLREFLDKEFHANIGNLDKYPEIKNDCISQFKQGNTIQKTQVLTLLRAVDILSLD
ncbi:MAG: hypothetical protein K8S87_07550 [Planctomycetes bacterium]|nr:hypothetical protein [Planctomycetota bacterium]